MVDPIVSKMPVKGVSTPDDQGASTPVKSGESKFDQVRTRLQEQQVQGVEIPPEVKQVSQEQIKTLETDVQHFRTRPEAVEGAGGQSHQPRECFAQNSAV
jgi:hypothetical protein